MWEQALLAAAPGLGVGLGQAVGGAAGPSSAALRGESAFDGSGWNINFGSGSIESSRSQAGELTDYMPYVIVGAAVLIVWRLTRKR